METQRGFTLIEAIVAAAIAAILGWQLLALARTTALAASHLDQRMRGRSAADRLEERFASDATTAWSIFVPGTDVNGAKNDDGHELDFVTEDASHRPYWWAYAFDRAAERVTKYAYVPGHPPAAAGEVYEGIANFGARRYAVTDLAKRSSEAYDPLFAGADVTAVEVAYGWNSAATGGNHLVRVRVAAGGVDRVAVLASGTAPSRFTIVVEYTPPPPVPTP